MTFDLIFYGALLLSSLAASVVWRSTSAKQWNVRLIKAVPILLAAFFWSWQIALLVIPKGWKWHEVTRIPRHLWMLNNTDFRLDDQRQRLTYGDHPRQYYHYYPAPKKSPHPNRVIIHWHGGAWATGSPQQHQYLAHLLQEQGYAAFFPAYRLTPSYGFKHIHEDVDQALLHVLDFLKTQGIESPELVLGGTSAGGNLATVLAYDEVRWKTLGLNREQLLSGVFSIAGALDLERMEQTRTLREYAGRPTDATFLQANPKNWVTPQDAFPFLCLHGTADGLVDVAAARSFCEEVRLFCPDCVDFVPFDKLTHLQTASMWYYRPCARQGQGSILLKWLERLNKPVPLGTY